MTDCNGAWIKTYGEFRLGDFTPVVMLPDFIDPTLKAVDKEIEKIKNAEPRRGYLGASVIGEPCWRKLWYYFRFASKQEFEADTLYKFDDGHRSEDIMAGRLRLVKSLELHTHDPDTGQQFAIQGHGGHFRGHMDGAIKGILQAPKTWHVWEHKCSAKQNELFLAKKEQGEKSALEKWDPVYFAQGQIYMHLTGMKRHYLTCSTPGTRTTISVRTNYEKDKAEKFYKKAGQIIFAKEPLHKLSNDPDYYRCHEKWCAYRDICHYKAMPDVNCRTCAHSTPTDKGTWVCEKLGAGNHRTLSINEQQAGCQDHLYIPALVTVGEFIDADFENVPPQWVRYKHYSGREFFNVAEGASRAIHDSAYSSKELKNIPELLLTDPGLDEIVKASETWLNKEEINE